MDLFPTSQGAKCSLSCCHCHCCIWGDPLFAPLAVVVLLPHGFGLSIFHTFLPLISLNSVIFFFPVMENNRQVKQLDIHPAFVLLHNDSKLDQLTDDANDSSSQTVHICLQGGFIWSMLRVIASLSVPLAIHHMIISFDYMLHVQNFLCNEPLLASISKHYSSQLPL